ncbi:hypothetical protein E2C01_086944 [Portunus trituberculatus]|uniref:Uncharacterized protein n=1 Tax=Portunus trituberculatus TaxID=210409 RepID=A0A5B7J6P2_PORTR|nr:hypothetical protein [Portunus trituberculatus]
MQRASPKDTPSLDIPIMRGAGKKEMEEDEEEEEEEEEDLVVVQNENDDDDDAHEDKEEKYKRSKEYHKTRRVGSCPLKHTPAHFLHPRGRSMTFIPDLGLALRDHPPLSLGRDRQEELPLASHKYSPTSLCTHAPVRASLNPAFLCHSSILYSLAQPASPTSPSLPNA